MEKETIGKFVHYDNSRYDIPKLAYYIGTFKEYPSAYNFASYYDVTKIYKTIFDKFKVEENKILAHRIKDSEGNICYKEAMITLMDGMMLHIYDATLEEDRDIDMPKSLYEDLEDEEELELEKNSAHLSFSFFYNHEKHSLTDILAIEKELATFKLIPRKKGQLNIVISEDGALSLRSFKIAKTNMDLELNYGSEFNELHTYMYDKLNSKVVSKGLAMFYGEPGTGKTMYIRHLINSIVEKRVIYLSPDMADAISSPSFVTFLMNYPNSILVIEDAENILKSRKAGANGSVANLLNLADGLLSDCLNMQIICTFNCDIGDIDSALMRKGRMIAKHEFKALNTANAQKLVDHLGERHTVTKDMTLAEIYNLKEKNFTDEKKVMGFGKK